MSDLAGTGGDELERRDDEVVDGEVEEQRGLQWQQEPLIAVVRQSTSHSGPMPSPQQLAEYDKVVPGLAREIVDMAKREQSHRHDLENLVVRGDRDATARGQKFGLAALVLMLLIAAYMVHEGHAGAAAWLLGTSVAAVVGVFVTGRVLEQRSGKKPDDGDDEAPERPSLEN